MGAVLGQTEKELTPARIEAAIEWYERIVDNPHWGTVGIEWEHIDTALETLKATKQALQKQLVDRIPCEWCAPETTPGYYVTAELPGKGETSEYANFCPMCGRRLPEANQNGTL